MERRAQTWKDNFLLHMNRQCHDNLKYLGPILNQIIVEWSNAVRHNINGKYAPFFDRFLENIVPYVPFCNNIGCCFYILENALVLSGNLSVHILNLYCLPLNFTENLHFVPFLPEFAPFSLFFAFYVTYCIYTLLL